MPTRTLLLLGSSLLLVLGTPSLQAQTCPDDDEFAAELRAILPSPAECGWNEVPWRTQLRTALVEAEAAQRPVLLWAMNGHPLGQC